MSEQPSKLRLRFETVGSITAMVVGVAALFVSWDQGRVMREEIKASVWPALQVDGFFDTASGRIAVGLNIENAGVGPALIERVSVKHYGELLVDLDAIGAHLGAYDDRSYETATGRILAAGAQTRPFTFWFEDPSSLILPEGEGGTQISAGPLDQNWSVEVCYCSSLDECWIAGSELIAPHPVNRCDSAAASAI